MACRAFRLLQGTPLPQTLTRAAHRFRNSRPFSAPFCLSACGRVVAWRRGGGADKPFLCSNRRVPNIFSLYRRVAAGWQGPPPSVIDGLIPKYAYEYRDREDAGAVSDQSAYKTLLFAFSLSFHFYWFYPLGVSVVCVVCIFFTLACSFFFFLQ